MMKKKIFSRKGLAILCGILTLLLIATKYRIFGMYWDQAIFGESFGWAWSNEYDAYFYHFYGDVLTYGNVGIFLLLANSYIVYRMVDARWGLVRLLLGRIGAELLLLIDFDYFDFFNYRNFDARFRALFVLWLAVYLLLGLVFKHEPHFSDRLFGEQHENADAAPVAVTPAPVVAAPAQPLYEETTVTCPIKTKAFSKALTPYIRDGWKVEKITNLDRKNRLVYLKRKK